MSPEQLMGRPLDGRSDIYGLGVLAYELMTGQLPFPDAVGPAPLISAQLKRTPNAPSTTNPAGQIPRSVDALILRMLEKDRTRRFAHVIAVRDECLRILATEGPSSGAGPQPQASRPAHLEPPQTAMPAATASPAARPPGASIQKVPGPATQAIIDATAPSRRWIWVAVVLVIVGGAIGALVALQ